MKKYEKPKMEFVKFLSIDIIANDIIGGDTGFGSNDLREEDDED